MGPTNFRTYEAQSRLLAAVLASQPNIKLNFKAIAQHYGSDTSESGIEHRFRPVKKQAAVLRRAVAEGKDPLTLVDMYYLKDKDITKYYGESTPLGVEFQFRQIRKDAKTLRDAVDKGQNPLTALKNTPAASPSGRGPSGQGSAAGRKRKAPPTGGGANNTAAAAAAMGAAPAAPTMATAAVLPTDTNELAKRLKTEHNAGPAGPPAVQVEAEDGGFISDSDNAECVDLTGLQTLSRRQTLAGPAGTSFTTATTSLAIASPVTPTSSMNNAPPPGSSHMPSATRSTPALSIGASPPDHDLLDSNQIQSSRLYNAIPDHSFNVIHDDDDDDESVFAMPNTPSKLPKTSPAIPSIPIFNVSSSGSGNGGTGGNSDDVSNKNDNFLTMETAPETDFGSWDQTYHQARQPSHRIFSMDGAANTWTQSDFFTSSHNTLPHISHSTSQSFYEDDDAI